MSTETDIRIEEIAPIEYPDEESHLAILVDSQGNWLSCFLPEDNA